MVLVLAGTRSPHVDCSVPVTWRRRWRLESFGLPMLGYVVVSRLLLHLKIH